MVSARVLVSLYGNLHVHADGAWAVAMLWAATSLGADRVDYAQILDTAGELAMLADRAGDTGLTARAQRVAEHASKILSDRPHRG